MAKVQIPFVSYQLIHPSWNKIILKFDLENLNIQCQIMVEVKVQVCMVGPTSYLTHIPFVPCQLALPFLRDGYLEIWPWKSKFKFMGAVRRSRSHSGSNDLFTRISFCSMSIGHLTPGIWQYFKIGPWKCKARVTAQGHIVGPTSYPLTFFLFHFNRPSHSQDTSF